MNDIDVFFAKTCAFGFSLHFTTTWPTTIFPIYQGLYLDQYIWVCVLKLSLRKTTERKKHTCNRFYIMFFFRVQMHSASSCCSKDPWRGVEGFGRVANVGSVFLRVPSEGGVSAEAVVRGVLAMRCSSRFLTVVAALAKVSGAAYALQEQAVCEQMKAITPI